MQHGRWVHMRHVNGQKRIDGMSNFILICWIIILIILANAFL